MTNNLVQRSLFFFLGLLSSQMIVAQSVLQLDSCVRWVQNYPLSKQYSAINQIQTLQQANLQKNWWPQVSVSGQATYQSTTFALPIKIPGINIETPAKDQYKVYGDIQQTIFDGGITAQLKSASGLQAASETKKIDNELYKIKEKVVQLFFNALFIENQTIQTKVTEKDLLALSNKIKAATANGISSKYNEAVIEAEITKLYQKQTELKENKAAILKSIGNLVGKTLSDNVLLELPSTLTADNGSINRAELELMAVQKLQLANQATLATKKTMPKVAAFAQFGYGRPALNPVSNEFESYFIGGLKMNWNLSSYYTLGKEKQILAAQSNHIDAQKEAFNLMTENTISTLQLEIEKFRKLIESDTQIIAARTKIKVSTQAMLDNGVISYSDYLKELDAEDLAKTAKAMHEIQLLQTQYQLQLTKGNL